jgi:hypothetical protein
MVCFFGLFLENRPSFSFYFFAGGCTLFASGSLKLIIIGFCSKPEVCKGSNIPQTGLADLFLLLSSFYQLMKEFDSFHLFSQSSFKVQLLFAG